MPTPEHQEFPQGENPQKAPQPFDFKVNERVAQLIERPKSTTLRDFALEQVYLEELYASFRPYP